MRLQVVMVVVLAFCSGFVFYEGALTGQLHDDLIGLFIATLVVLGALVFDLFIAGRKPEVVEVAQKKAA